jgi:hypothetical protein
MSGRPDLQDYVAFFEAEPEWVHEQGWYYGVRFVVSRGDDELTITVAPDEAELVLIWKRQSRRKLALNLKMVVGWQIESLGASEHLIVRVNTGPEALCGFEYCLVRVKPHVEVDCQMSWGPGWEPSSNSALHGRRPSGAAEL